MQPIASDIYTIISQFLGKEEFSYSCNTEGYNNLIYIIEGTYILKVSKTAGKSFSDEMQILQRISEHSSISIPKPLLRDEEKTRFLYEMIQGEKLNNECIAKLSKQEYEHLISELATFLHQLHALGNHRLVTKIGLMMYDKGYNFYHLLLEKIASIKDIQLQKYAQNLCKQYAEYISKNPYIQLGLLHNDLYDNNLFFTHGKTLGIIDFSDATIGDIHLDFTFLYHPNNTFRSDLIDKYCNISGKKIDKDFVALNCKIFIINEYLHDYKIRKRTEEWIEEWMNEEGIIYNF